MNCFLQINNAATASTKSHLDYTAEDVATLMGTNFESCFHLCQLAHPLLKASGYGNVVFISSVSGLKAFPLCTAYAASKGTFPYLYIPVIRSHHDKLELHKIIHMHI